MAGLEVSAISCRAQALLAAALLAAPLSGCDADARRAGHIARGRAYLSAENVEKARVEFAEALQISPRDSEARFLSGQVAERLGNPSAAASMYQAALEANPDHVAARAALARLYVLSGMPASALELVEPGITTHPGDPNLLTARGAARAQLKDDAGAMADAQRAVQLAPANEGAVSLLAGLLRRGGESARAADVLTTALQKLPNSVDLRQVLAKLDLSSGDSRGAEEQLSRLAQIRPRELQFRLQLASFYLSEKRVDDAERTLRAAVAAMPESNEAKLVYVDFLASHRSRAQGEAALRELIARDPGNPDLQLGLGGLQQRAGAEQDAAATYRAIIAKDPSGPKSVAARDRIAAIDITSRRYTDALALLAEALEISPADGDALTLRGNIELERGDAAGAIVDLRAVLRDHPSARAVRRSLARAHLANHEPALAEETLRAALSAAEDDVGARVDLGELLTQTQRADEAVRLLEETVKSAPGTSGTDARRALVEAYLAKGDLAAGRSAAEDLKTLRPDLATGSYLAGVVAQRQQRLDDAQREYERALRLAPSAAQALSALAQLEFGRGQHEKAIALVDHAIEQAPDNAAARNLLGELYMAQKSYPQAVGALSEAVRLAPAWWLPYRNLALTRLAANDEAGGAAEYEAGLRATTEPALAVDLAALYERKGRIDDAIRLYEQLHERDPRLEIAANNLAMLLVTYRTDQASLDRARNLSAPFANSPVGALLDTHGWVMLKRGELTEALSALQRASAEAPDSKVILYHLGIAQLKAGQPDKARASLEAALAGGASFTGTDEARLALTQLKRRAG
jgi:tetratricopeptide (TPR) repeat protein